MKKHLKESEPRSSSRVAEESALHQLCYIRTRFVSLHFDPFSVFTLEHFCHIPGDIFNCVILSKYFFSCLLLFCFVVIKFHFYGIRRLNVKKEKIIITLCFLYWLRETVGGCWWCVLIYDRLRRILFEDVVFR